MGCDVMKKLFASLWPRFHCQDKPFSTNTEKYTMLGTSGPIKLWHLSLAVLLAASFLGFSSQVRGQAVNATLLGTVTDSSGAAAANVRMTISETNTGISRTSRTNESGNYVFPDLPPGTYAVTAELSGFKPASDTSIHLILHTP